MADGRHEGRERVLLELEALPDPAPVAVRLRNLLKTALRRDRLRCVSATPGGAGVPPREQRHAAGRTTGQDQMTTHHRPSLEVCR
jgi:hypothetical protein